MRKRNLKINLLEMSNIAPLRRGEVMEASPPKFSHFCVAAKGEAICLMKIILMEIMMCN
jgi:hypothetical protein